MKVSGPSGGDLSFQVDVFQNEKKGSGMIKANVSELDIAAWGKLSSIKLVFGIIARVWRLSGVPVLLKTVNLILGDKIVSKVLEKNEIRIKNIKIVIS